MFSPVPLVYDAARLRSVALAVAVVGVLLRDCWLHRQQRLRGGERGRPRAEARRGGEGIQGAGSRAAVPVIQVSPAAGGRGRLPRRHDWRCAD